jgi:hypothetical protein
MVISNIVCIELPQPTLLNPLACKHLQLRKKHERQTNQTHFWCSLLTTCSMQIKMKAWNAQNESPERLKQNQTKAL